MYVKGQKRLIEHIEKVLHERVYDDNTTKHGYQTNGGVAVFDTVDEAVKSIIESTGDFDSRHYVTRVFV